MYWLKKTKNRLLAAFLTAVLLTGVGDLKLPDRQMAWWGMLYPEFCFSHGKKSEQREERDENTKIHHRKISFWILSFID